jgi:hypothetical protein
MEIMDDRHGNTSTLVASQLPDRSMGPFIGLFLRKLPKIAIQGLAIFKELLSYEKLSMSLLGSK